MKKKFLIIFNLIFIIFLTILCNRSQAESRVNLTCNKDVVSKDEEFNIIVNNNTNIAAFTIWIYFDNEKVECISESDNINVEANRIIYTWFSDTGRNKLLTELLEIKFKAKENGVASFAIIGEFYNENGDAIDVNYNNLSINIGDEQIEVQSEIEENENVSGDDANLEIMRLGQEGISPDFDSNVQEYYLVVDEDVEDINVTAVPRNREAEVKISGNKNLKMGKNTIEIEVTSKDKTNVKKYVINLTRTNNIKKANADLETLAIENYELNPEFSNNITNYKIEVSNDTNNLNVLAIPINMKANVKIEGKDDLKVGNNKVIVTVTAEDNITIKKYNIEVYKRNDSEEAIYVENEQKKVEEANTIMEKVSTDNLVNPDTEITEAKNGEEQIENNENFDKIFMITGTVLSLIVLGIVIIRIKKEKY